MKGVMKRHMIQRTITIEKLLEWTYLEEMADVVAECDDGLNPTELQASGITGHRNSTDGVRHLMRGLGCDPGGRSMAAAHPDAERVHKTVKIFGPDDAALIIAYARSAPQPCQADSDRKRELYNRWRELLVSLAEYFGESVLEAYDVTWPEVPENPYAPRDTELSSNKIRP